MRGIVVPLTDERDVETLRQISLLLERENQRLITKNLQLTAELARLRGLPEVAQLTFAVEQTLQQTRAAILDGAANRRCRSSRFGTSCWPIGVRVRRVAGGSPSWSGNGRRPSASPP